MSEFNGKKFYGFSLHNDPALLTTTRNFEFRYTRPENLERVIQKVQLSDGAEAKQKKLLLAKYCKLKKREPGAPFHTRDADVETHVSRNEVKRVRDLSENEIDQLIGKAKSTINMIGGEIAKAADVENRGEGGDGGSAKDGNADKPADDKNDNKIEEEQEKPLTTEEPTSSHSNTGAQAKNNKKNSPPMSQIVIEEIRNPHPKWVEIEEAPHFETRTVAELKMPHCIFRRDTKTVSLPTVAWQQMQQKQMQQETVKQQSKQKVITQSQTETSLNHHLSQQPMGYDEEPPSGYYVEDSDYEYEMLKRPGYTKYCGKRPTLDEMTNVSNDSGGVPNFIEIEPHIPCMDLSFLKNANPIRYTDLTDDIQDDDRIESQEMKIYIKNLKQNEMITNVSKSPDLKNTKGKKHVTDKKFDVGKRKFQSPKHVLKPATPTTTTARCSSRSPPISPRTKNTRGGKQCEQSSQLSPKSRTPKSMTPRSPRIKNIILTRSIEELKSEKVSLFNKMNATQERIIEIMDKLRMNLLEIYVPDSNYEKNRRQKNAFEFAVRFSRNFLYPLKGMVEDLRTTTKEAFTSITSNEACIRVANIYVLILQSLQTYQRQLRFFSLEQVPQKLTALIEIIHGTTSICLDKSIFAANDPIIECLLDRCSKFVGFIEDLHEERFVKEREVSGRFRGDKSPPLKSAVHAKYDLKMFMNDLNMYEPKLVPKRTTTHSKHRSKGGANAGTSSTNTTARRRVRKFRKHAEEEKADESSSQLVLKKAADEAITTQIQNFDYEGSSDLLTSVQNMVAVSNEICGDKIKCDATGNPLNQAVIEALQMVTKEQVRQVLEPIIQTLGHALDKKNNSETIEAILKALNTKIFSTTTTGGDENKKRHDSNRNSRMRSKVAEARAADSTSSILNASNASKAVKQTKKRAERQKLTKTTTSRSSSKHNNNNSNNPSSKSSETHRIVIEPDDDDDDDDGNGDAGEAGDTNDASFSESYNDDEWQSLNGDNDIGDVADSEELNETNRFAAQPGSRSTQQLLLDQQEQQRKQQQQQQLQQEKLANQQQSQKQQPKRKQSKNQPPKTRQQQRTELFLQRKRQQEQQVLQHQQQLKELHELHKQLVQKQNKHKTPVHRKQPAKRQNQQHNQQQHTEKQQRHKSQERMLPQCSSVTPLNQHQMQRRMSQRQVKERPPSRERDCQQSLPLQKSLRQLRHSEDILAPCAAVSNPLTTMNRKLSSSATPMSAATTAAHSEIIVSQQRSQKQKQQYLHQQQHQQQQIQQQQQEEQEDYRAHRPPAPCHKNKSRLFKKRRNPLRSPPPAPTVTPLNSARSKRSARFDAGSDLDKTDNDDEVAEVCVEELPHAMTHLGSANSNYSRECNKNKSNNNNTNIFYNYNNNTDDNETQTSARCHEAPPTATSNGDGAAAAAAAQAEANLKRSLELNQNDTAAAAKAIAAALETINVNENTNVLNLLQSRVISDVLVKCLIGVNPSAVGATQESEDEDNDNNEYDDEDDGDDDDDDEDDADDDDGEEEFEFEERIANNNNNTRHNNSKVNVGRAARAGNDDVSTDTEGRDVIEVASYVSTARKRRVRKTLEQQVRQNYHEQLNALYASKTAFSLEKLQQLQQTQEQFEPASQKELHMKLLRQQEDQSEQKSEIDLQLQQIQQVTEPQNQKQLHIQQLLLDQALLFNSEIQQQNPQPQRRPLNDINYLQALPNKSIIKENDLSQVFMEVLERNKQQSDSYQKSDLKIDSLINARDQFLGLCSKNRFYVNPNYAEPWKVFSRLSAKLASEIVSSVEEDFSIGVSKFVQDFLELETHN